MGLLDRAKGAIKGRSAMVEKGVDAAARQVNQRTGGKYAAKVQQQATKLKAQARQLDDQRSAGTQPGTAGTSPTGVEHRSPGGVADAPAPTTPDITATGGPTPRGVGDPEDGPGIR